MNRHPEQDIELRSTINAFLVHGPRLPVPDRDHLMRIMTNYAQRAGVPARDSMAVSWEA